MKTRLLEERQTNAVGADNPCASKYLIFYRCARCLYRSGFVLAPDETFSSAASPPDVAITVGAVASLRRIAVADLTEMI